MTCLESMQSPTQKLRNSFLSILVPIILRSDKNCGCAGIFRDAGSDFYVLRDIELEIMVFVLIPSIIKIFWYFLWLYPCILGQGSEIWPKIWLLLRLGLPTRQNPRWPPFYRRIAIIVMKYVLIDIEWWFWCQNVGLSTQGIISTQQKNLYVKYLIAKSKMAAILSEKSKYSHEIWINWPRMVI